MNNPYLYLIRLSWRYAEGRRKHYVLALSFFLIANVVLLLEPIILALFFNRLQEVGLEDLRGAFMLLALYPLLELVYWMFFGTGRVVERVTAYHIVKNFRTELFSTLTALPLKWHKDHHSGNLMSRLEKGSAALKGFSDESFQYHEVLVKFVGSVVALFILNLYAGLLALVFSCLVAGVTLGFDRVLVPFLRTINQKWHHYDATFYDYIVNVRTVITLRLEELAKNATLREIRKVLPLWKKNAKVNELKWFFLTMVIALMMISILGTYLLYQSWLGAPLLFGSLVALYEYTNRLIDVFFNVAWKYEQLVHYRADLESLDPIWSAEAKYLGRKSVQPVHEDWQAIDIKNLYFRYDDERKKKYNLSRVSLRLQRGGRIALIGESGGGKSTCMTLLRSLQEPQNVEVLADGQKLSGLRSLSSQVTLIPQDPEIFENTIEYNVSVGLYHRKDDVDEAIRMARFQEVLERLPKGLKTSIKEKGVNLSGGEKQRLALARGIFAAKHSSILLLDEPTSSVDPANEAMIYDELFEVFKDKCIISSIHRLHLLPKFDYVYLFDGGAVKAEGTFEELMKKSKRFQSMWAHYEASEV